VQHFYLHTLFMRTLAELYSSYEQVLAILLLASKGLSTQNIFAGCDACMYTKLK